MYMLTYAVGFCEFYVKGFTSSEFEAIYTLAGGLCV